MYIIIVGCGRVGSDLAQLLAGSGHNVVVIDKEASAFQRLGTDFNGLTVIGDGFDVDLLKEAGIEQADAFCTVTGNDNANIMSGQVARKIFHIPNVITRINDPQYTHIYQELGIKVASSTRLLAATIRNKIVEGRFSSFLLENGRVSVMEIETNSSITGKSVAELNLPGELLITTIVRKKQQTHKKEIFIPRPKDRVEQDDLLIAVVKIESLAKVKKFLGLK